MAPEVYLGVGQVKNGGDREHKGLHRSERIRSGNWPAEIAVCPVSPPHKEASPKWASLPRAGRRGRGKGNFCAVYGFWAGSAAGKSTKGRRNFSSFASIAYCPVLKHGSRSESANRVVWWRKPTIFNCVMKVRGEKARPSRPHLRPIRIFLKDLSRILTFSTRKMMIFT